MTVPLALMAVGGCGEFSGSQLPANYPTAVAASLSATALRDDSLGSAPPRGGDAKLSPAARGKTVLVVGDSWAQYIGTGMSEVTAGDSVIVNAGLSGCGIMLPYSHAGKEPPAACLEWPEKWPEYMKKYQPDAVLVRTANWDLTAQTITRTGVDITIKNTEFRKRFDKNVDRALGILTQNGTPVYLTNAKLASADLKPLTVEMNRAVREVAERHRGHGVHLLDLAAQLCNDQGCPEVLNGHKVYDETGHPAPWSRDRLARWILNSMFAEDQETES